MIIDELAEHAHEFERGVGDGAAVHPAVQVSAGPVELHVKVRQAAQAVGDGDGVRVPHAGVRNEHEVGSQIVAMLFEERREVAAAALFFALDQDGDFHGELADCLFPASQRFDEGDDRAFVIAGAARGDDAVTDGRFKRRTGPLLQRVGRLHVVMAIEQHVRCRRGQVIVDALRQHDRVPSRLLDLCQQSRVTQR